MKEELLKKINNKTNLLLLGFSYILYSITYGVAYNNVIYNHDSVSRIYVTDAFGIHLQSGRPMRDIFEVFPAIGTMSPALMYLLTFIFIFANIFILVKLFRVNDQISRYLIAMTCITFPITAIYWGYGNDVWIYAFALAMASLTVYFVSREKYVYTILSIVVFLGTYQSMLSYAVTLYLIYEILMMSIGKRNVIRFIKGMSIMVLGAAIYYILLKLLIVLSGQEMTTYLNADSIGLKSIIINLPITIKLAYKNFMSFIFGYHFYIRSSLISSLFTRYILVLLLMLPILYKKLRDKKNLILYIIGVVVLPIFLTASTIVTNIYLQRSDFGMLSMFIFVIIVGYTYNQEKHAQLVKVLTLIMVILFAYTNFYAVNEMFFKIVKKNDINESIASTIYMDLQKDTDYTGEDKIAICGDFDKNENISWARNDTNYLNGDYLFTAEPNVYWDNLSPGTEIDRYKLEIESIFRTAGYDVEVVDAECKENTTFYPKTGYINEREDGVYEINIGPLPDDVA